MNISTGEPSTLGTYKKIATILTGENSEAVKFFERKIQESPNGENEAVIAHESQMLMLIMELNK